MTLDKQWLTQPANQTGVQHQFIPCSILVRIPSSEQIIAGKICVDDMPPRLPDLI